MEKKKRPVFLLLIGIFSLTGLGYFISIIPPQSTFSTSLPSLISPLLIFFLLLFLTTTTLAAYMGNSMRRGVFFGLFVSSYLLLRLNNFTEQYFAFMLLAVYISLELFFTRYQ